MGTKRKPAATAPQDSALAATVAVGVAVVGVTLGQA